MFGKLLSTKEYDDWRESMPESWYQLGSGSAIRDCLQKDFDQAIAQSFGYFAIKLGPLSGQLAHDVSPIKTWVDISHKTIHKPDVLVSNYQSLPIASDSVDLVVVSHLLEYVPSPHLLLREIERIIIPGGKVIISGINPLSWYRLKSSLSLLKKRQMNENQFIGLSKVMDWLKLLGFEELASGGLDRWCHSKNGFWFGQVGSRLSNHYFIMAEKTVSQMTLIRPSWRTNRKLVPARLSEGGIQQSVERICQDINKKKL